MTDIRDEVAAALDRIRDETRAAVLEGDAEDCSSADCIADTVWEICRVALRHLTVVREGESNPWRDRLVKAERDNHCGDGACQTRRTSAAVRVLTGWKEHQDYCWAVEIFEVELGIRDPATVGPEPSLTRQPEGQ